MAVGGIVALLFFMLADDSGSSPRRRKSSPAPAEATQVAPAPDSTPAPEERKEAPPAEKPKPRKAEKPPPPADNGEARDEQAAPPAKKAAPPAKKIASGRVLGMLSLNPGPNVPVVADGSILPKQVGAFNLPITSESGIWDIDCRTGQVTWTPEYYHLYGLPPDVPPSIWPMPMPPKIAERNRCGWLCASKAVIRDPSE